VAVREWSALPTLAIDADAILVATAAPAPTVTADLLAVASAGRGERPLRVVDLAVPRNVDPAARALPGIELSDLDTLRADRCPVADDGTAPVLPDVERVLDDELDRLLTALRGRAVAPRLAELHRESARVTDEEVERALCRLAHLGDAEREVVREMAERLVRRVLYPVSRELRRE
jgi:glutamyl-tRNA reductase